MKKVIPIFIFFFLFCERKEGVYYFPDGFLWGAGGSAYQTEGGNFNNDWYQWEKKKFAQFYIKEPCGRAVNFYELYDQDIELAKALNLNSLRFSVEWSRVEPVRGKWNDDEIDHYRKVIEAIKKRGMKPVLTLHHFTNPIWVLNLDKEKPVEDIGGWENPEIIDEFVEYAEKVAQEFGKDVDIYLTINEPIIIVLSGYMLGVFPPGKLNLSTDGIYGVVYKVFKNIITAHARAYRKIKEVDKYDADGDGIPAMISLPETIPVWEPVNPGDIENLNAIKRLKQFYTYNLLDSLIKGGFDEDLDGNPDDVREEWKGTMDFIGLNYYNRWFVVPLPVLPPPISAFPCPSFRGIDLGGFLGCPRIEGEISDAGYEVYPEGIYRVLKDLHERYRMPILITENGIATDDAEKRREFIRRSVRYVAKAMKEGVDIKGYIYWSLTDNWEWGSFDIRFGLYRVDYNKNLERSLNGGDALGQIAECNCIDDE
jgi:beta-glucosidase